MCIDRRTKENLDIVKRVLDGERYHYLSEDNCPVIMFPMVIKARISRIEYKVRAFDDAILVFAEAPVIAPCEDEERMGEVTEMICRINYGLRAGSFDLDVCSGKLIFRCCIDCEDIIPSEEMVRNSIACTSSMFRRYADAILDVFFGGGSAEEAVAYADFIGRMKEILEKDLAGGDDGDEDDSDGDEYGDEYDDECDDDDDGDDDGDDDDGCSAGENDD